MSIDKLSMFENRLVKVFRHLGKQARRQGISCYRVYDHDLPEFPFMIEFYDDKLCVAEYKRRHNMTDEEHDIWLDECIDVMSKVLNVKPEEIYVRQRKRKEGRGDQYQKNDGKDQFFTVKEQGLEFLVNLTDYLDTGLFLDHRITRNMFREEAKDKKVLNLFCYTGSFSVYAAAGDASEIVSIDLSNTYINWAKQNMMLNQLFDSRKHQYIKADVLQYMEKLPKNHFDLVILDPPTFSNSKMMKDILDIQRDHVKLVNQTLDTMTSGGVLYFSNNYRKFQFETDQIKASLITDITKKTTPFDFEGKLFRWCYKIKK
jgi:23S rRNA (cytosine1962-C5)-methyltransferase